MCCVSLCDVDPIMTLSPGDRGPGFCQPSNTSEAELKQIQQKLDTWNRPSGNGILCLEFYRRELGLGGLVMRLFWA